MRRSNGSESFLPSIYQYLAPRTQRKIVQKCTTLAEISTSWLSAMDKEWRHKTEKEISYSVLAVCFMSALRRWNPTRFMINLSRWASSAQEIRNTRNDQEKSNTGRPCSADKSIIKGVGSDILKRWQKIKSEKEDRKVRSNLLTHHLRAMTFRNTPYPLNISGVHRRDPGVGVPGPARRWRRSVQRSMSSTGRQLPLPHFRNLLCLSKWNSNGHSFYFDLLS